MRILGIDYGTKRVGIAVSDIHGKIAFPKVVLKNTSSLVDDILKLVQELEVGSIVIGESRGHDGKVNAVNEMVLTLQKSLEDKTNLPVILEPEFLTSFEAARYTGEGDNLDAGAAAIILQRYLEKLIVMKNMNSDKEGGALSLELRDKKGEEGKTVGPIPLCSSEVASTGQVKTVSYDDFKKLEIKIGKILTAEKIPDTDKLLKLSVDFGETSPRQIVSGISTYFPDPQTLVGMKIAFAANLEPRKIRGFESQGMILAVGGGDSPFSLLKVSDDIVPGSSVK
ncbi:MAG: Holliday junction resolvase RuvX [Candidatus Paceibacterota bacterium]|jgi:methionyl-tRNA synthetase